MSKKTLKFNGKSLCFSAGNDTKLNWLPFTGTCLFTDTPSDGVPGGSDKPVLFPADEVSQALSTMENMGVNCVFPDGYDWSYWPADEIFAGHDYRFKIGTVTSAELKDNEMQISGGLWDEDFPDVCELYISAKKSLGFSIEVVFNCVDSGEYYTAKDIEFTGVAILFADLAAFNKTYIAAQAKKGDKSMTKEELGVIQKALSDGMEGIKAELGAQIETLSGKVDKVETAFAAQEKAKKDAEEQAKTEAELAVKKAEEERVAKEKADKEAAELAEKQKKDAEKLNPQRKSTAFNGIYGRFGDDVETKRKAVLADKAMNSSQQFQALLKIEED